MTVKYPDWLILTHMSTRKHEDEICELIFIVHYIILDTLPYRLKRFSTMYHNQVEKKKWNPRISNFQNDLYDLICVIVYSFFYIIIIIIPQLFHHFINPLCQQIKREHSLVLSALLIPHANMSIISNGDYMAQSPLFSSNLFYWSIHLVWIGSQFPESCSNQVWQSANGSNVSVKVQLYHHQSRHSLYNLSNKKGRVMITEIRTLCECFCFFLPYVW